MYRTETLPQDNTRVVDLLLELRLIRSDEFGCLVKGLSGELRAVELSIRATEPKAGLRVLGLLLNRFEKRLYARPYRC